MLLYTDASIKEVLSLEDRELVEKVVNGDFEAFEELFNKYKGTAMRTAYLICGNKATSEDIVQETFVQCYLNIGSLKNPDYFKTWFYKILTRMAWKLSKSDKKSVPIDEIFAKAEREQNHESDNMTKCLESETVEIVRSAVNNLDEKYRAVVVLYYFNGFSVKEIANMLDIFEGTVKSRLFKARRLLKGKIESLNYFGGVNYEKG